MQWDTSNAQAGFSSNPKTWLPVPSSYKTRNVQSEKADPDSLLNWHRELIAVRRSNPALAAGEMRMLDVENTKVLSYERVAKDGQTVLVALNMSGEPQTVSLDTKSAKPLKTLMASPAGMARPNATMAITLPPFGAWVGAQ
jgi:alpha-glucosidase